MLHGKSQVALQMINSAITFIQKHEILNLHDSEIPIILVSVIL